MNISGSEFISAMSAIGAGIAMIAGVGPAVALKLSITSSSVISSQVLVLVLVRVSQQVMVRLQ